MIPARAGSKGLPGKNTRMLCGKPLISYAIESALSCDGIDTVYVNSDDPKCLGIGLELGAKDYARPSELGSDVATMQSVTADFVQALKKRGESYDAVIVLYPTYPLRTSEDLSEILKTFHSHGGSRSLIGAKKTSRSHPFLFYNIDENQHPTPYLQVDTNKYYRRQDYPKVYELTLFVCVIPFDQVESLSAQMQNSSTAVMKIDAAKNVDVDSVDDFALAEAILSGRVQTSNQGK
jgi:CMP-N-acetylneuraminic acid synthetase